MTKLDSISEARLQLVLPQLADKIRQMADIVANDPSPIKFRVTQGVRSWTEQYALWLKGRNPTNPGPPPLDGNVVAAHEVVTKAPPGYSWHQFGLAVDVVPLEFGGIPDWNATHPCWKRLIEVGVNLGLGAGAQFRTFPDFPHFQLVGSLPENPNDEIRQIFKDGGTVSVWREAGFEVMA